MKLNFHIQNSKTVKINNPVDFDFIEKQSRDALAPQKFSSDFKNVVAIGNLSSRKGFDLLLNVFARLKNEKILLHILGDGRDKELLLNFKKELGLENVIFHGQQKNPYQFLKHADLFVLSSRYEGFPNVLLEAGACGTYSLANDCPGGIREIILPNINGEIENIEQPEAFAEKIKSILQKKFNRETVKESIRSRFSKDIIFQSYFNLFQDFRNW